MNVCVRLFAAARQLAGRASLDLDLPERASIGQLRRRLAADFPQLSALTEQALFAIDRQYARDEDEIRPGSEVACIPPVSGG